MSIRMRSPIFNPKISMVTCSTAAGEGARDEPLDTEDTVETGDRAGDRVSERNPKFSRDMHAHVILKSSLSQWNL